MEHPATAPPATTALAPSGTGLAVWEPTRRAWVALVLLTLALQGYSWWLLDGYQLADSVEYMERARALVRSTEVIDSRTIRSFGFSGLLLPIFALAEWTGVRDMQPVVAAVRLFQMLLGLGLVVTTVQFGRRLANPATGMAAGFLVASNPIFLQYSVSPIADIAAALCVGRALLWLLAEKDRRSGERAGFWLGLACSMAYKTAPLAVLLVLPVALRNRRGSWPWLRNLLTVLALWVVIQVSVDRLVYREWGASLFQYFIDNVGGVATKVCLRLGWMDAARWIVEKQYGPIENLRTDVDPLRYQVQPTDWYWAHRLEMLVWPVLVLAGAAVLRTLARPRWKTMWLLVTSVAWVALLHQKPSKDFRLWLPLLPVLAPLLGETAAWAVGLLRGRWRPVLTAALGLWTVALAGEALSVRNTRKFSDYWDAIEWIAQAVREGEGGKHVASAYHWAVYMREGPDLELEKLASQVDGWASMEDPLRERVLGEIRDQDWFLTHLPILTSPDHALLTYYVAAWYEVVALFYDHAHAEELGPVLVMRRKSRNAPFDAERMTLFDVMPDQDPDAFRRSLGFPEPIRMIRPAHNEEMWFLGATYEVLPGDGYGWLTTYVYNATSHLADYEFLPRLTTYDERAVWQDNHAPTYGVLRTNTERWAPGTIVREGRPVVAAQDPYEWTEPFRPIGADYRRGDLVPVHLWFDVATHYRQCIHCGEPLALDPHDPHVCGGVERTSEDDGRPFLTGRLERARFGDAQPLRKGELEGVLETPNGWRWSADGYTLVSSFFLPVHPEARVADDGKPISD